MKKLLFILTLLCPYYVHADTLVGTNMVLVQPTTGAIDINKRYDVKLNENFKIIATTLSTIVGQSSDLSSSTGIVVNGTRVSTITFSGAGAGITFDGVTALVAISSAASGGGGGASTVSVRNQGALLTEGTSNFNTSGHLFATIVNSTVIFRVDLTTINTNLSTLATDTGTLRGEVTALHTDSGTLTARVDLIATATGALRSEVNSLHTDSGTLTSRVDLIATATGSLRSEVNALHVDSGTLTARVDLIATATGSLRSEVNDLHVDSGTLLSALKSTASLVTVGFTNVITATTALTSSIANSTGVWVNGIRVTSISITGSGASIAFSGDGATITVTGGAASSLPLPEGSTTYVQNQGSALQTSASFYIETGTITSNLHMGGGSLTWTNVPFSMAGPGPWDYVMSTVANGAISTLTITGIPLCSNFYMEFTSSGNTVAGVPVIRLNADSGNNYANARDGNGGYGQVNSTNAIYVVSVSIANTTEQHIQMWMKNKPTARKTATYFYANDSDAVGASSNIAFGHSRWRNNAQVTQIDVFMNNGGTMRADSELIIWGRR